MVTTYRFRSDADKMLVLLNSDHNPQGVPMAFATETDWRQILPGSPEAQFRKIGLRWLRGEIE